ncbi:hypothetical protein BCR32DRAFT_251139 [Anaeromyces robustus]|uniref:Uncharacterized protein n=1 Tax=Anaeromyces robustus TaxID=1754192 RepID=A0A1Y1VSW3_9FUNG|nr:hypothetical protein BCR32DRAFT_251139 [Anaeromyces robustus]|eukprot:ORX64378.1 hypothetical protein BCR32DRAFT_251139 [Anaeromyces robustus]
MVIKLNAKSYNSNSFNVLVNTDFIFEHKLKCIENVFIKPITEVDSIEIQLTLLPKSTVNKENIYIPNWIFKYWKNENINITNNLEVVIEIIKDDNISTCDIVTINKVSNNIFFPTIIENTLNGIFINIKWLNKIN